MVGGEGWEENGEAEGGWVACVCECVGGGKVEGEGVELFGAEGWVEDGEGGEDVVEGNCC